MPFVNEPLVPTAVAPGGPGFVLTVNGTGFVSGATVNWDGQPLQTAFISRSQLTAFVPSTDIAVAHTASITVLNPGNLAASNVAYFQVTRSWPGVYYGYAPGSPINISEGNGTVPMTMVGGDLNGDGKLDLAVAMQPTQGPGHVLVLLGKGDGTFTSLSSSPRIGTTASAMAVVDFNGDGKLDLAVANAGDNTVTILVGNGDGTFIPAAGSPVTVGRAPTALADGDFNGDGNLDLAVANSNDNNVAILLGHGDGSFSLAPGSPVAVGNAPFGFAVGDFNNDGDLDLAVTDMDASPAAVAVLLGRGDGSFNQAPGTPITVSSEPLPMAMVAGDFNSDGKTDLAVTSYEDINATILLGAGDGSFTSISGCCGFSGEAGGTVGLTMGQTRTIAVGEGDLSGDGRLGLVFGSLNDIVHPTVSYVTSMAGLADGTFTPSDFSIFTPSSTVGMVVADFNNDGRLDVATAANATQKVAILLQVPPPTSPPDFSIAPTSGSSISIPSGGAANYALQVSSLNGLTGVVTLTCSGLPTGGSCAILNYLGNAPEPAVFLIDTLYYDLVLHVTTQQYVALIPGHPKFPFVDGWLAVAWLAALGALVFCGSNVWPRGSAFVQRSSLRRRIALFATLVLGLALGISCSGGSGSAPSTPAPQGTPPGTYTLTVTGTSGALTHSVTFTLNVQ